MNILLLTDYYPPDKLGGVGEIVRQLRAAYRAMGHTVFVVTTGTARNEEIRDGIFRSSTSLIRGVFLNNLNVLRLLRRERISLVHMHQSSTTLFLLARPFLRPFPFVLDSLQVSYITEAREIRVIDVAGRRFRPSVGEYLERFLFAPAHVALDFIGYALSNRVTVVSRGNRDELLRTFGRLRSKPLEIVPNGVPAAQQTSSGFRDNPIEERLRGKFVLTYVGVFRTRKRVQNLLMAVREIAMECPQAVLLLVGGGRGYEEAMRALAIDLGIADRVVFAGKVPAERVSYYLSLTDVFALLSSYEGMPVAMLEAMSAGKAVVAADGYGMRDLLSGGDSGVLVPVDDIPATAEVLRMLVRCPERRQSLGRAARAYVHSHLAWHSVAEQYLQLVDVR
jgi:glycosyltransferase involved in cell wall biosynthesis